MQTSEKIMWVFIASLVGEFMFQLIIPGHQQVRLFIRSSKILVSSPYSGYSDEGIYDDFFDEFAFLLDPINMLWEKIYTLVDAQIHGKYN